MGSKAALANFARVLRRVLGLLDKPVRADRGRGGMVIQPFRGYGSTREAFLMGRVYHQHAGGQKMPEGSLGRDLFDIGRRLLRQGVGKVLLTVRYSGAEERVETDPDGYFRLHLRPAQPPPGDRLWHPAELELAAGEEPCRALGEIFVPPPGSRFVVVSDIDDTVILTGVANKLKMIWRLFAQGARSRTAFPGVAAFYRALHQDPAGALNPILYVSRGPWSLYEVLDEFFQIHRIPVGPILFLRVWGLTLHRPLPRRAKGHKLALIRQMLSLYDDLPFILIGDSGQHDPEIYTEAVREHPGRVLAIYIRNVSRSPQRQSAIEALAREVVEAGSSLLLAADSFAMAEHAAERGYISAESVAEVLRERISEEGKADLRSIREVRKANPRQTRRAVERGEVAKALDAGSGEESPPNVVVEPGKKKTDSTGRLNRSERADNNQ